MNQQTEFFGIICREDPDHAKAHFRRAIARHHLGYEQEAEEDFEAVKRLDPAAVADVDRELARIAARRRIAAQKQRREWKFAKNSP